MAVRNLGIRAIDVLALTAGIAIAAPFVRVFASPFLFAI